MPRARDGYLGFVNRDGRRQIWLYILTPPRVGDGTFAHLLCVMQSTRPINDDVGLLVVETNGSPDRARGIKLAELEEAIEHWTVLPHVKALQLSVIVLLITHGNDRIWGSRCRWLRQGLA